MKTSHGRRCHGKMLHRKTPHCKLKYLTAKHCTAKQPLIVCFLSRCSKIFFSRCPQKQIPSLFKKKSVVVQQIFFSPTPEQLYLLSFVKTSAPGGLPSSGTVVLTDCLKNTPTKNHEGAEAACRAAPAAPELLRKH